MKEQEQQTPFTTVAVTVKNCPAFKAYENQRYAAKRRDIGFELTFAEWHWLWLSSGKLQQRGRKPDQYCMARLGPDIGPYARGNVAIKTVSENCSEQVLKPAARDKMSAALSGRKLTEEHKARIAAKAKRKPIEADGVRYEGVQAAANALGVDRHSIIYRLKHWPSRYKYLP